MNNEFEKWQEKCKESGNKRNDYLTWDEYFMAIAKLSSKRSKDPNTQVGACIVSNECAKLIIQSGIKEVIYLSDKYNGTDENIASKRLFDTCKVKYKQIECKEITI